jgi:hypothetical protein
LDQLYKIFQNLGTPSAGNLNEICIPGLDTHSNKK